ncbi:tRNA-modifying protein YgfZ [Gallaecimonas sp. GXIMD4217]|uniref:tRNA-modifying protein YgfZ n=1 Tax=Gallaecimonas sp. GXIMD4217 TaxID=3131927 RepID=UPI00311AE63F
MTQHWQPLIQDRHLAPLSGQQQPAQLALIPIDSLGLVRLSGPDATSFLQGQVTLDVTRLDDRHARLGAHCDAKGKMQGLFRAFKQGDDLLLLQDKGAVAQQLPALAKYAVFSKVELTDASDTLLMLGVTGDGAEAWLGDKLGACPQGHNQTAPLDGGLVLRLDSPFPRYLVLLSADAMAALVKDADALWLESGAWVGLDILAAEPSLPAPLQGEYVPQQLNLQLLDGIAFDKGCYAGQEVVARMHYRGGNKRAMWHLAGSADKAPQAGDALELSLGDNFRPGGVVVASYRFGDGSLHLLAVCRNDLEGDERFRVKGDEHSALQLAPMPYAITSD